VKNTNTLPRNQRVYGPLQAKTIESVLLKKFMDEYGYSDKRMVAKLIIEDMLGIIDRLQPPKKRLKQGEFTCYVVSLEKGKVYRRRMEETELVPVVLKLFTKEELKLFTKAGNWKKARTMRIVRMAKEAVKQGGILSTPDLSKILSVSCRTISKCIQKYEDETGEIVPIRGTLHDIGRKVSHKRLAISKCKSGKSTPEVAREINHSVAAVDRYDDDFGRVFELSSIFTAQEIAKLTKISVSVVREYLELIKDFYPDKHIKEYEEKDEKDKTT